MLLNYRISCIDLSELHIIWHITLISFNYMACTCMWADPERSFPRREGNAAAAVHEY